MDGPADTHATDLPATPDAVVFSAVLHPNRSLGPRGFRILMLSLGGISVAVGALFLLHGAWPVVGFLGLDVLAVWIAFKASYRSGRLYETVQLTQRALVVRRVWPRGQSRTWTFQPHWLRVSMDDPPDHASHVTLSSHGRSLVVGSFLSPEERLDFAKALQDALSRLRQPPHLGQPA